MIIVSPPGSDESVRGVAEAVEAVADLVLIGEGARHALRGNLDGFCGTAFAVKEDFDALGLDSGGLQNGVKLLPRDEIGRMLKRARQSRPW